MVKFAMSAAILSLALAAGAPASALSGKAAHDPALALGRTIAGVATTAERAAADPDAIQSTVRSAVQQAIITAAADPQLVLAAIDTTLAVCRPSNGRASSDWSCPSTAGAYLALNGLRLVVVAQLEQTDPAALRGPGSAPFGSVMTTAPTANYTSL